MRSLNTVGGLMGVPSALMKAWVVEAEARRVLSLRIS